jgi:hypothetical protein
LGQILILDFAYISREFASDLKLFSTENEEISAPPPCGLLIGIYLFSENWSTETFKKKSRRNGLFVQPTKCEDFTGSEVENFG